ncbi:hypothetical protein K457DRAFT_23807 [Linnemannia elongata AG-77]|uniref:VLRF1 domain-containing protein n=1 Tax=Linnemannia elongata AG-77 TaxID=1314771 RepID=A0A197JK89_9FUNG|nr:hypothetical protein K457DRAFT_23807 [Linnemannia elongata AG-77]
MDSSDSPSLSPAVLGSLRSLSVFFLPKDLIDTLTYSTPDLVAQSSAPLLTSSSSSSHEPSTTSDEHSDKILSLPLKVTPSCRTCAVPMFASVDTQREHVKSDWHLYNLKQQLLDQQAAPVSFHQFQDMILTATATTTTPSTTASRKTIQQKSSPSTTSTSMVLCKSSEVAIQTIMSQLDINVKENKQARESDPVLLRQRMIQEQQLQEIRRSPMLWFSSTLYGTSVQFGIYKNALTNKGNCDHLVEHIKSIQIPVPPPPPKRVKAKRAARAKAKALLESQQKQQSGQSEETEQDLISALQKDLENAAGVATATPTVDNTAVMEATFTHQLAPATDAPPRYWTLILLGGGHFAGMVVDVRGQAKKAHSQGSHARELKIVAHKTFHRYTVRRKNGGAQSSFGAANSAGAMVRMYNERALKLEVRELLDAWSDWILQSECVFMHAPGNNKRTVFYEDSIMNRADREGHLRSFPFMTRRPTLTELKRAYQELTTVKIIQPPEEGQLNDSADQAVVVAPRTVSHTPVGVASTAAGAETVKTKTISTYSVSVPLLKLVELVKKGRVEAIDNHFARTGLDPSQMLPKSPRQEYDQRRTPTLLHLASFYGQSQVVQQLLEKHGADPTATISSLIKRMDKTLAPVSDELLDLAITTKPWTAYDVAKDKETRNAFRRAMARMPDAWDWTGLARVPSALTPEMEAESRRQGGSKSDGGKRSENESDGNDEVVQNVQPESSVIPCQLETPRLTVQERMIADREKRAQAAETRRAAQLSARAMRMAKPKSRVECNSCGTDLGALSPFERFGHPCNEQSKLGRN